jgi:hypothetical protein
VGGDEAGAVIAVLPGVQEAARRLTEVAIMIAKSRPPEASTSAGLGPAVDDKQARSLMQSATDAIESIEKQVNSVWSSIGEEYLKRAVAADSTLQMLTAAESAAYEMGWFNTLQVSSGRVYTALFQLSCGNR